MKRILVAEDDNAVREFVRRALSREGYEVVSVPDGVAALDALAAGEFDLLLTDVVMPGLDGIALALKAKKDRPEMRILLMSGFAEERRRAHNLDELIHDVVAKPFTLQDICAFVARALA
jgi:DNA-binding response OmpR family regulator